VGTLFIKRSPGIQNILYTWHVILDGEDIGTIKRGKQARFEVTPQHHTISMKWAAIHTQTIEFDGSQDIVLLECGVSFLRLIRYIVHWEGLVGDASDVVRLKRLTANPVVRARERRSP
jgi:hypothetical protein